MRLSFAALLLAPWIVAQPAHACKPCLGDPIELSQSRSAAVLIGKVEATLPTTPTQKMAGKQGPGEARLLVKLERWLVAPPAKAPSSRIEIRSVWDGACLHRPDLPEKGQLAIFFLAQWNEKQSTLTGYCTTPVLRIADGKVQIPTEAAEAWGSKPVALREFENKFKKLQNK